MHAELRLESIAFLLENLARRELLPSKFARGRVRDDVWDASFISTVMENGIFGCIMLTNNPYPRPETFRNLTVVDGGQRINALARLFLGIDFFTGGSISSIYYDVLNDSFIPIRGVYSIELIRLIDQIRFDSFDLREILSEEMKLSGIKLNIALDNIDKFRWFMHIQIPCYYIKDNGNMVSIFNSLNNRGLFISPEDSISGSCYGCSANYNTAGIKANINKICPDVLPVNSKIIKTDFTGLFGFKDIDVAVMTVPSETINVMASSSAELIAFYQELLGIYRKEYSNIFEDLRKRCDKEALPVLNGIERDEIFNCERYKEIQSAVWLLYDAVSRFLPEGFKMITLNYSGVFISKNFTVGSTTYTPGCYVSEDLYGVDLEEIIRHETAHAFFYYHKKKFIQCPWIEEGLAEVAGKNTPGTTDYLKAEPSKMRYYNFLVYLQTLPVKRMKLIVRHWIKGDVKSNYWCKLVKEYTKMV